MTKNYALLILAAAFLIASCGSDGSGGDYKYIEYDLRGTWERTAVAFWPEGQTVTSEKGKLIIDFDTVKIIGPVAHLSSFTHDTSLEAYTEDGKLYIKDNGVWQSPQAYTAWESGGYPPDKMLTLKGGGITDEPLKLIGD